MVTAGLLGGALYLVTAGAVALVGRDHRRSRAAHLSLFGASVAAALVMTLGFTALTVRTAVHQLGSVTSLSDLVGTANLAPVPAAVGPKRADTDVVVIGDSTAAGIGNAPLPKPTRQDIACQRSADAYAFSLRSIAQVSVLNLACSSATAANGLLGPQPAAGLALPPQVGVLRSVQSVKVVVVSIGANDVGWSDFLRYCYGLPRCDDQVSNQLFQSRLDGFKIQYAQLLQQLSDLPTHPRVIVTKYYDPLGSRFDCPALQDPQAEAGGPPGYGFGPDPGKDNQDQKIKQKIGPLRIELARMNAVLQQGAAGLRLLGRAAQLRRARAVHRRALGAGDARPGPVPSDRRRRARDHRGRAPAAPRLTGPGRRLSRPGRGRGSVRGRRRSAPSSRPAARRPPRSTAARTGCGTRPDRPRPR